MNNKEVFLYVAGDGQERENLENKINKYSLDNHVFLLGYQKNIGSLLQQSDIYLHPCYVEGFGIAVAEAMMAKKPIIVSNDGAMPELIVKDAGLLVDKFDTPAWARAIVKLIADKKYAQLLATNANIRAKQEFSKEKYVENYKDLYLSLLEQK